MSKLNKLGAKYIATRNFKRVELLVKGKVSNVYKGHKMWARVRTDGKYTTITLKERKGSAINHTDEWEVKVDDFKTAVQMLCKMYKPTIYEENKRIEYKYDGVQITIDKWPELPWIVEIEGASVKKVREVYKRLALSRGEQVANMSIVEFYKLRGIDWVALSKRNREKLDRLLSE
ncbi:MAG: CYTH domain-containing protein [Candidatus Marsarchaeota archaeon]|nr:CYTH domain-containing protein [Candidatus Marsarchaeota archaeon]